MLCVPWSTVDDLSPKSRAPSMCYTCIVVRVRAPHRGVHGHLEKWPCCCKSHTLEQNRVQKRAKTRVQKRAKTRVQKRPPSRPWSLCLLLGEQFGTPIPGLCLEVWHTDPKRKHNHFQALHGLLLQPPLKMRTKKPKNMPTGHSTKDHPGRS